MLGCCGLWGEFAGGLHAALTIHPSVHHSADTVKPVPPLGLFFFKQKTAYELRKGDWSSDVCSSDLLCPWVDLTGRTQRPPQDSPLVFSPETAHRLAQAYLAGHPADDPLLSPLQTPLAGLPPLLIHAAAGDAVLQEAQLLARHATQCGVEASVTVYPVPTHDFHIFWSFLPEARDAIDQLGRF